MTSPMDELLRKVLNDRRIFDFGENGAGRLFGQEAVIEIRKLLARDDLSSVRERIQRAQEEKQEQWRQQTSRQRQQAHSRPARPPKNTFQEAIDLSERLGQAASDKLPLVRRVFDLLDEYGAMRCQLPTMEDYGKVVENQDRALVEAYFAYQIDKTKERWKQEALRQMLSYLEQGYESGIPVDQLGFFVRKSESLKSFVEV